MCQADKEVLSFKLDAEGRVASLPEAAEAGIGSARVARGGMVSPPDVVIVKKFEPFPSAKLALEGPLLPTTVTLSVPH